MTALTGVTPLTSLGGDPSYIRMMSSALASLPAIRSRRIPLPDGTVDTVLEGTNGLAWGARISATDYPAMPIVRASSGPVLASNENAPSIPVGWMFHGIRWQSNPAEADGNTLMDLRGTRDVTTFAGTYYDGPRPTRCQRILFNQCSFESDINQTGRSMTKIAIYEGDYMGWVNCLETGFYGAGSSETKLFETLGDCRGPHHWENNEFQTFTAALFTGGGGARSVDVRVQDLIWQRNWQHCPLHWRRSECNPFDAATTGTYAGLVVNVAADGVTVTPTAGARFAWAHENLEGPHEGCIMYEPATGKARRIASAGPVDNAFGAGTFSTVILDAPGWGGPVTGITVYLQTPFPNVQYNSGMDTPMPLATTTAASATVTFNTPIPAGVRDETTFPGAGHFFYLNNTHWSGGNDQQNAPYNTDPLNTGYGWVYGPTGIAKADCRRKKILTIAGDRLSCVLEGPYFESRTFPYSCVVFDGLWRTLINKGTWETKVGNRILWQGNVFEFGNGGGTQHPTAQLAVFGLQGGQGAPVGQMTVVGNAMTVISGGPIFQTFTDFLPWKKRFGLLGPRLYIGRSFQFGVAREVVDIAPNRMSATLAPVNAAFQGQFGDVTDVGFDLYIVESPWFQTADHVSRYNLIKSWKSGTSTWTGIVNIGEHVKGLNFIHHDNLFLDLGDLALNQGGSQSVGLNMATGATTGGLVDGSLLTGAPIKGDNGTIAYYHNTHVRGVNSQGVGNIFTIRLNNGAITDKARDIEIADNVMAGFGAGRAVRFLADSGTNVVDPNIVWDEPVTLARNIAAGSTAPGMMSHTTVATRFPDNIGLPDPTQVGFANYSGGTTPFDPAHYALVDVYTTGTVNLAANGLSATLASGVFPSTVVPGQFFRTNTAATELRRITSGGNGSPTVTWTGAAHSEAGQSGKPYAITFKGTASDATDPGADMALVESFTRGVRTASYV